MIDYEKLYYKLFRETEIAIKQLIHAQQTCEELYLQKET